jgi:hypothetical protein
MTRRNGARADRDYGLVCPSCGALSEPDPDALRAAVHDVRVWAHCLDGLKPIVRALLGRLAQRRRQPHPVLSHD